MYERIKGIYLITRKVNQDNGEPVFYIGQADNIFDRFNSHCTITSPSSRVDKAIKELLPSSFSFEILEEVSGQDKRDLKEQEYIAMFSRTYSEASLYNNQSGGKKGSTAINLAARKMDAELRKKIKAVFKGDISYSVYLIAEQYGVQWKEVCDVRKPLLKKNGLRYDTKLSKVVDIATGMPPGNWHGGVLTNRQIEIYQGLPNTLDVKDAATKIGISVNDFKKEFIPKYLTGNYQSAEMVCDIGLFENEVS
jgi:group I intron endonuclease